METDEQIVKDVRKRYRDASTRMNKQDVRNLVRHAMLFARHKFSEHKIDQMTEEVIGAQDDS